MNAESGKPVDSELYSKEYFLGSCGGIEFFDRYGPTVLKPAGQGSFLAGWDARVRCVPNAKRLLPGLYGGSLPVDFPIRPAPSWKRALSFGLLLHRPLDRFLAREFLIVARPRRDAA